MNLNYSVQEIAHWSEAIQVINELQGAIRNICIDSRSPLINNDTLFIALKGSKSNGINYCRDFVKKGGRFLLLEQEVDIPNTTQFIVKDGLKALQCIATIHRSKYNIPVVGITGSNGKTTVKEWLYHILKSEFNIIRSPKSYNSQIGVPLSVLELDHHHTLAIFEAGISQKNEMAILQNIIKPTIGVFTGIGDAHQHNFQSIEEKETEKRKLFSEVQTLISIEDTNSEINRVIPYKDKASQLNSALAFETALALGCQKENLLNQLKNLPGLSMRLERMEGANGNILINDTYTFDELGLEIGLHKLKVNANQLSKVLVLAPETNYKPSPHLMDIIKGNNIETLIWIHPNNILIEAGLKVYHYKTVAEFMNQPILIKKSIILFSGSRNTQLEKSIPLFQLKKHITKLEIDLRAIRHNLDQYRQKINNNTKILAMVKAQSYGGGILEMAKFLAQEKIDYLGVAYTDEGVLLRQNGITAPILVMNPEQSAFDDIIDYNLEPSIYSLTLLNQFLHQLILKGRTRFPIHIKLDTGMTRLGFQPGEINEVIDTLNAQPEVHVQSVFSHMAVADDLNEVDFSNLQIEKFKSMAHLIKQKIGYSFIRHIANSEGTLNFPHAHFDMVRIGIGLFGLANQTNGSFNQVLSFKSQISQIKTIQKGDTVGYGRHFTAQETSKIGIVPVGYADGLSRQLSNGNWLVKVGEQFVPIIGSICMDMCMIDLTGTTIKEMDEVEIFGWGRSIQKMAQKLNTIPYEIISSISSRVHRVYFE